VLLITGQAYTLSLRPLHFPAMGIVLHPCRVFLQQTSARLYTWHLLRLLLTQALVGLRQARPTPQF